MNEELKILITAEIDSLRKEIGNAINEVKKLDKESKKNLGGVKEAFQKAGEVSTTALKVAAGAVVTLTGALLALSASTKEYREGQAKLISAFQTAGGSAETAKQTYNDLYRVLGDSDVAVEASNHLAQLTTNQKDLQEWTSICQGVYATFGDSLPIESLTEAANETAKTGEITGALADALNWAGVSEDEFAESLFWCNSEAERETLIRNTLNGLYSDASAAYETNAASILAQNEAQAKMTDALAALGEAVQPIMTMLTELGAEVLAELTPYIQEFAAKHLPAVKEALEKVGEAIGKVINWIVEHWELVSTIATIVLAIAAAFVVFNGVMSITNALMALNPWVLAIAAVIAAIVLCIKYWDEIKAVVSKVVNAIWNWIKGVADKSGNAFKSMGENIKKVWNGIVNFFSGIVTKIKNLFSKIAVTIGNAITNTVKKAINGVLSTAVKIINGFISAINAAIGVINKIPGVSISKLNKLDVPKLAKGGIVDGATLAVVGEQGKEAVMPLENNTEWIDILAARLAAYQNNDKPIILQIDGKTFAQTSISAINNLTRQTGKLGLVFR